MVKMLKFIFLFFIFLTQCFGAFEAQLQKFDKEFSNSKTETQIKYHHHLKSLYIQSIIDEDEKSKNEILKRLVISSKTLNFDSTPYIQELKDSGVDTKELENSLSLKKNDDKKQELSTFNTQAKEVISAGQNQKLFILKSFPFQNGIELLLSQKLEIKDLKNLVLKEKDNFRYIIDFNAVLEGNRTIYEFNNGVKITLSQYDPQTARIVLNSKEELECAVGFEDLKMRFAFKKNEKQENVKVQESKPIKEKKENTKTQEPKQIQENKPINNKKQEKTNTSVKKENDEKKTKNSENTQQKERKLEILSVKKTQNAIILEFNEKISKEDISSFTMKDKNTFRYVWDIKATLKGKRKNFTLNKSDSITVAQFNPSTVRVVLNSTLNQKPKEKLNDTNLELSYELEEQSSKNLEQKTTVSKNFKANKIIVIDAGHGGKDSGALGNRLQEKNVVLNLSLKIGDELKKRGYKVFYTRNKDKFINLRDRTKFANDKNADLFISVHANAVPKEKAKSTQGFETFFLSPARSERSKKAAELENQSDVEEMNYFSKQTFLNFLNREKIIASNKLAIDIQKGALKSIRTKYKVSDGGVREAPFWVLVGAQMPAVLIEIGYITHPDEGKRIANKNFQNSLADGIADGVENYFRNNY
ncbi:N-acetylmuramoyl-L-alanine amidase [Campylobacter sp. CCS1377]|uniref:N-acetylmuramoyl-L-alanine amidase n=1 Tax=Campylobacter sp. CCS1377 TaxID=3158229 RepID=A0AAU7E4I5_9BACT